MERIGSYKVVDELARGPRGRVVRASRIDSNSSAFAIKLQYASAVEAIERSLSGLSWSRGPGSEAPEESSDRDFFERADLQKRAAASGTHWLPVHEVGSQEQGQYYVTDFHRHTAGFFVTTRTRLSGGALGQVLSHAVAGLKELEQSCGRAHGNLKLNNLLLMGTSRRGHIRLKLTDPAPSKPKPPSSSDDAYALGEILYQLVTFQSFRTYNWPIHESEEWTRLGHGSSHWLRLCNDLLNPDCSARLTIDQLRLKLAHLIRARQVPRLVAAAGIAIVVLSASAGWKMHSMEASADRAMSEANRAWLSTLINEPEELTAYSAVLRQPVISSDELARLNKALDLPRAGYPNYRALSTKRNTVALITDIQTRLAQVHQTSIQSLSTNVATFDKIGWTQPARQLKSLNDRPQAELPELLDQIEQVRRWNNFLSANPGPRDRWDSLDRKLSDITKNPDADLAAFARALRAAAGESVAIKEKLWTDAIADEIDLADDVLAQGAVLRVWPRDFNRERLVHDKPQLSLSHPSKNDVKEWISSASQYAYVPIDPARDPKIDSLNRQLVSIDQEKTKDPTWFKDPNDAPKYDQLTTDIRGRISSLGKERFVALDLDPGGRFFEACRQLSDDIPRLRQLKRPVPDVAIIARQLTDLKSNTDLHTPNVAAYWNTHLNKLGPVEKIPPADREIAIKNTESVAAALLTLDKSLPIDPASALKGSWLTAASIERAYRLDELLKQVGNTGTMLNDSTLKRENDSFVAWCAFTAKLAHQFPLGPGILDSTRVPSLLAEWSRSPAKEFWTDHVQATTSPLHPILERDLARLAKLQEVLATSNRSTLLAIASETSGDEERVLAAWDRLNQMGTDALVPTTSRDLRTLATAITNIRAKVGSPRLTSAQKAQRDSELPRILVRLWTDAVNRTTSPDLLATAWQVKDAFGMGTNRLAPPARFNVALARMQANLDATPPPDAIAELKQSLDSMEPADSYAVNTLREALRPAQSQWSQLRPAVQSSPYLWPNDAPRRRAEYAKVAVNFARQLWDDGDPTRALDSLKSVPDPTARALESEVQESVRTSPANQQQGIVLWQSRQYPQALEAFTKAARGGDLSAKLNLGGMYRTGQGTRPDPPQARIWFTRAAKQGSLDAMIQLADLLDADPTARAESAAWYEKASAKGSITATAKLASIDVKANATRQATDHIATAERLEASTPVPNPDVTIAMTDLARLFETQNNATAAKDWYTKAAARKSPIALDWIKRQEAKSRSRIRIEDKVQ